MAEPLAWIPKLGIAKRSRLPTTPPSVFTKIVADDVAVTKRTLASQDGPVILVGHSYGGGVITEAGNDPKVVGLAYITAFAPDKGESVATLIKDPPPGAPVSPILPPQDGYLFLDRAKFRASFAADVDAERTAFMADSQVPWGVEALSGKISEPAWRRVMCSLGRSGPRGRRGPNDLFVKGPKDSARLGFSGTNASLRALTRYLCDLDALILIRNQQITLFPGYQVRPGCCTI